MLARIRRRGLTSALAFALATVPVAAARAATLTVSDLGDTGAAGQLRTLMNAALPGDTILVPAGTITLSGPAGEDLNAGGDLDVLKDLTIQGAGPGLTVIDANAADRAFDVLGTSVVTLSGMKIENGTAAADGGGGIRNLGTLTLSDLIVTSCTAAKPQNGNANPGGAIRNLGTLTGTRLAVQLSTALDQGGGIYNDPGATLTLTDATISSNTAKNEGGGILNLGTLSVNRALFSGDRSDHAGGGIASLAGATATIVNATFDANVAHLSGGGVDDAAGASLVNVTFADNISGTVAAGAALSSSGTTTIENVLFGPNPAAGIEGSCAGTVISLGHNLDRGTTCALSAVGDLSGVDPRLGPFQDNGGPSFTRALPPGSLAVDAAATAACPPTDQRGIARPQGTGCDIGAYELVPVVLDVTPATLPGGRVGAAYNAALGVVVVDGGPYTPPAPRFAVTSGALPAGVALAANGLLFGAPTTAGNASFTVTATDGNGVAAARPYTLAIAAATQAPVLDLSPATLPGATVGTAYSQKLTVTVTNGVTYTPQSPVFSVSAGALPAGVTLSASGTISGTPTAAGTASFTVTATDTASNSAVRAYTLDVAAPPPAPVLDLAPATLPDASAGAPYAATLSVVVVQNGPYTPPAPSFAVTAGALPAGMTLSPAGAIGGTPAAAGSASFTVTATDGNGLAASRAYTLAVVAQPPPPPTVVVAPASLPDATAGVAYAQTLTAVVTNGVPYTPPSPAFTVSAGALPGGLTLSPAGVLAGTPAATGTASFTVTFTGGDTVTASHAYALTVVAAPPPPPVLDIAPETLPGGVDRVAYRETLTLVATNGVAYTPVSPTFAVTAGALPAGLALSSDGVLSGFPDNAGTATFTVTATDAGGLTASRAYTLSIAAAVIAAPPPPPSSSGCGCGSGSAGSLGLLLVAVLAARPRRRGAHHPGAGAPPRR